MVCVKKKMMAVGLLSFSGASARSLRRGLQVSQTLAPSAAPTFGCVQEREECRTTGNALFTCCGGLDCITTGDSTTGECLAPTMAPTMAPTIAPTAVPTAPPTCGCQQPGEPCRYGLNGAFTCCTGFICRGAVENTTTLGTCYDPPPPPYYIFDIPGTIRAGDYNNYEDNFNKYNIGGPRVGDGGQLGYMRDNESGSYGINVTANATYGVNYEIRRSGNPPKPEVLKFHMRTIDANCSNPEGRFAELYIDDFKPDNTDIIKYGAGDVALTSEDVVLTVCFEEANYVQVNSYIFGPEGSGDPPTNAPTMAPTMAPVAITEEPTPVPVTEEPVQTFAPTMAPVAITEEPTSTPVAQAPIETFAPTLAPIAITEEPTPTPTAQTIAPTIAPVAVIPEEPIAPTPEETVAPTIAPVAVIPEEPIAPTPEETVAPTIAPVAVTEEPAIPESPTSAPTAAPTFAVETGDENIVPGDVPAGNYVDYADSPDPSDGPNVGPDGSRLGYLKNGEAATYDITVQAAGTYGVSYWLSGKPPGPIPARMYLAQAADCSGPELAVFETDEWAPTDYNTFIPYNGGDVVLEAGVQSLTLCFDTVGYMNVEKIQFGAAGCCNPV